MQEKKEWQDPELIVLARSKPEEAILTTCKGTAAASGPYPGYMTCIGDQAGACSWCSGEARS